MPELKKGIYRHYKGHEYQIVLLAKSTINEKPVVIYKGLKDGKFWSRPLSEFLDEVETKKGRQARFELIKEEDQQSWENKYRRALADYHNLLKQSAQEKQDFIKYAIGDFLQDILPIYDHLKISIAGLSETELKSAWVIGVKHVLKEFKNVLYARGVEEIETKNAKFDHQTMEAISGTGDQVRQEIMPGYKLNGRVIRPAKVIVK